MIFSNVRHRNLSQNNSKTDVRYFFKVEIIYMSCPIFKFNDYKKKQERGLLITNFAVYNLKGT